MRDVESERRVESSAPVSARVDVRTLAMLAVYWDGRTQISSMSQLISWSLEVLVDALRNNSLLLREIDDISSAYEMLGDRGLMQRRMSLESSVKMRMARGFENMRFNGADPADEAPMAFKTMHNSHSVSVPEVGERSEYHRQVGRSVREEQDRRAKELYEKAMVEYEKITRGGKQRTPEEEAERLEETKDAMRKAGQLVDVPARTTTQPTAVAQPTQGLTKQKSALGLTEPTEPTELVDDSDSDSSAGGSEFRPRSKEELDQLEVEFEESERLKAVELKRGLSEVPEATG